MSTLFDFLEGVTIGTHTMTDTESTILLTMSLGRIIRQISFIGTHFDPPIDCNWHRSLIFVEIAGIVPNAFFAGNARHSQDEYSEDTEVGEILDYGRVVGRVSSRIATGPVQRNSLR